MKLPLAELRVWITRPGAAARRSASGFETLGARCTVEATVQLQAAHLSAEQRAQLRSFLPESRLVLTSANAAHFLVESLEQDPELLAVLRRLPVSAVGEATARAAEGVGLGVDHVASVALGLELAREIAAAEGSGRVLLPGSDLRRPETEEQLRQDGLEVLPLTVYKTVPVEQLSSALQGALRDRALDAVALYSPSALEGVLNGARSAGISVDQLPALLALGPTTAQACAAAGRAPALQPSEPGEPALLEAVVQWWSKRGASQ